MTDSLSSGIALSIVEHCPFPLLVLDKEGKSIGCNPAFERLVGKAQAVDLIGRGYSDLVNHPLRMLFSGENSVCWTDRNDRQHQFEIHTYELTEQGLCQVRMYIDISRQVELERAGEALSEELKQHVLTDDVTGLLNKRGVVLALEPQVARSRRYNSPISVIMLEVSSDVRHDSARLHIARLLKDQLRWADLIGCTENHEFILVLPETTPEASLRLADKLKQKLQEMADQDLDGLQVNACYGVTGWRRSDNAAALLKRAGNALQKARAEQDEHLVAL